MHTIVSTDASDYDLGAILSQVGPDGIERTVAFASHTLSAAECKYATVEKEALACVWAVERWRTYLWGRRFTLRTDHQALTTLLTTKGVGRAGLRVARWSARLMCKSLWIKASAKCINVNVNVIFFTCLGISITFTEYFQNL